MSTGIAWKRQKPFSQPPRLPAWYGLERMCRAAGLVKLVSSWAKLGSGNKPFLLLRIWRIKNTPVRGEEAACGCRVCAALMMTGIVTPAYIITICLCWDAEDRSSCSSLYLLEKRFNLHQHSQTDICSRPFAESTACCEYFNQHAENLSLRNPTVTHLLYKFRSKVKQVHLTQIKHTP